MANEEILITADAGRIRTMTLNRPERLNAFNDALYDAVRRGLDDAAEAAGVAVVIITGAGRAFTAGQDLDELAHPPEYDDGAPHGFEPFMDVLQSFPKPLIAAVNGIGIGIGLTMLPHCDLVLIAESAKLRAPFVSLGVTAEAGSTFLLPASMRWANAAHLLYTASWLSAREAVDLGLVWRIVDDDLLKEETHRVASEIAAMPIASLVATKKLLLAARHDAVAAARSREHTAFGKLLGGPANLEALAAFREKRAPEFD